MMIDVRSRELALAAEGMALRGSGAGGIRLADVCTKDPFDLFAYLFKESRFQDLTVDKVRCRPELGSCSRDSPLAPRCSTTHAHERPFSMHLSAAG